MKIPMLVVSLVLAASAMGHAAEPRRPNVLFIVSDDRPAKTPHIDRLVAACLFSGRCFVMADEVSEDTNRITTLTPEQARKLAAKFPQRLYLGGLTTLSPEAARVFAEHQGELYLGGLTALSPDAARAISEFKGEWLVLNGLTTIDVETAEALAKVKGQCLFLSGLTTLDADVARALAKFKRRLLNLGGLTTLSPAEAEELAEFKGQMLDLGGVATLSAAAAEPLAQFRGQGLYLGGLTSFDADTLKALAKCEAGRLGLGVEWVQKIGTEVPLILETARLVCALQGPVVLSGITAFESPDSVAIAASLARKQGRLSLPNLAKISPKTLTALIKKRDVEIPRIEALELIQEPDGSVTEDFVIPEDFQQQ